MIDARLKRQLIAFLAMAAVGIGTLSWGYLRVPESLGLGRYEVSVALPESAGLYGGAPVTYRGVTVGQVTSIDLTDAGVTATLSLLDDQQIPGDSIAEVLNASVIGEPGLDLVGTVGAAPLAAGATIPATRVRLPGSTAELLTSVNDLLSSVPRDSLKTVVHEAYLGLNNSEDQLGQLFDAASELQTEATKNQAPTLKLIEQLAPVLATQRDLQGQLRSSAANLGLFTDTLAAKDQTLRSLLATAPPAADQVVALLRGLGKPLASLLSGTNALAKVLKVYIPGLRHLLIVLPALIEANRAVAPLHQSKSIYAESGLSFKLGVNSPPVCTQGFSDAGKQRAPGDVRPAPLPLDSYCKLPSNDPRVVRGARNMPCPNDPNRRGATAALCGLIFNPRELKK